MLSKVFNEMWDNHVFKLLQKFWQKRSLVIVVRYIHYNSHSLNLYKRFEICHTQTHQTTNADSAVNIEMESWLTGDKQLGALSEYHSDSSHISPRTKTSPVSELRGRTETHCSSDLHSLLFLKITTVLPGLRWITHITEYGGSTIKTSYESGIWD